MTAGEESPAPEQHADVPAVSDDPPIDPPVIPAPAEPPKPDPWAHRRTEPRTFAFIWTMFLFFATVSTYAVTMSSGIGGHDVVRPAARLLLILVASGVVIIWPLVRLSQPPDERPIVGPILDFIVILVPVQAIVWPQAAWWLAGWPITVVAALTLMITAWALITAAVISCAHSLRRTRNASPAAWMALILVGLIMLHAPAIATMGSAGAVQGTNFVRTSWMASPLTAVFEISQDRTWVGTPAAVFPGHWRALGFTFAAAGVTWIIAAVVRSLSAGRPADPGLH